MIPNPHKLGVYKLLKHIPLNTLFNTPAKACLQGARPSTSPTCGCAPSSARTKFVAPRPRCSRTHSGTVRNSALPPPSPIFSRVSGSSLHRPQMVFDYLDAGADDKISLRRGKDVYSELEMHYHILSA